MPREPLSQSKTVQSPSSAQAESATVSSMWQTPLSKSVLSLSNSRQAVPHLRLTIRELSQFPESALLLSPSSPATLFRRQPEPLSRIPRSAAQLQPSETSTSRVTPTSRLSLQAWAEPSPLRMAKLSPSTNTHSAAKTTLPQFTPSPEELSMPHSVSSSTVLTTSIPPSTSDTPTTHSAVPSPSTALCTVRVQATDLTMSAALSPSPKAERASTIKLCGSVTVSHGETELSAVPPSKRAAKSRRTASVFSPAAR